MYALVDQISKEDLSEKDYKWIRLVLCELCPFVFFMWKSFFYFSSHEGNQEAKADEEGSVLCELCPFVFLVWKPFFYFSSHEGNQEAKADEEETIPS